MWERPRKPSMLDVGFKSGDADKKEGTGYKPLRNFEKVDVDVLRNL